MILICQGLVFETETSDQSAAFIGFGVITTLMLLGALGLTVFRYSARIFRGLESLILTKNVVKYLDKAISEDFLVLYSSHKAVQNAALRFR